MLLRRLSSILLEQRVEHLASIQTGSRFSHLHLSPVTIDFPKASESTSSKRCLSVQQHAKRRATRPQLLCIELPCLSLKENHSVVRCPATPGGVLRDMTLGSRSFWSRQPVV